MRRKAVADSETEAPDYSKVKIPLARRKEIFWKLMDICRSIGVFIEFKIKEVCPDGEYLQGSFDAAENRICIFKPLAYREDIDVQSLWVMSHECRHAQQFNQRLKPDAWMYYMGVYLTEPLEDCNWLENDADEWACEFINQHLTKKEKGKIIVP